MTESRGAQNTYLLIPILVLAILASIAVIRGPSLVSLSGFGSAIIVAAPLILATYALMAVAIAGRGTVDLAVGPLLAFINVSIVSLNGLGLVTSPLGVFAVAIGIGVIYQVLFALVIIIVRVQPIIVALSGFLALSGINRVILPRPGGTAPEWMASWGLGNLGKAEEIQNFSMLQCIISTIFQTTDEIRGHRSARGPSPAGCASSRRS